MEVVLLSFTILITVSGATGAILYYYHRIYGQYAGENRKQNTEPVVVQVPAPREPAPVDKQLRQKQLEVFSDIATHIGDVKSVLEYTTGEETLRQWKNLMVGPLREILRKSYQWSLFMPEGLKELPAQYASRVLRSLSELDTMESAHIEAYASILAEIRQCENQAADEFQQKVRMALRLN